MKGSQISRPAMGFFCSSNHGDCCCFGGHQKTSWGRCLHQFQIENAIAFWVHHTVLSRCLAVSLAHWKLSIPDIRLNSSIWNIRTQFVQALSGSQVILRMEWNNPTISKCWKPQSGWTCGSSKVVTLRSKLKKCSKSLFFLQEKHRRCWRFLYNCHLFKKKSIAGFQFQTLVIQSFRPGISLHLNPWELCVYNYMTM